MPINPNDARWKLAWVDSRTVPEDQKRAVWKKRLETLKEAKKHVKEMIRLVDAALKTLDDAEKASDAAFDKLKFEFAEWEPHPVVALEGEGLKALILSASGLRMSDVKERLEDRRETLLDDDYKLDEYIEKYSDANALLKNDGLPAIRK